MQSLEKKEVGKFNSVADKNRQSLENLPTNIDLTLPDKPLNRCFSTKSIEE
jgi:hypothetical protein